MMIADATVTAASDVLRGYDPQFMVGCYFPAEFQGEFVMQVSGGGGGGNQGARGTLNDGEPIQYSTVNITFNAIPVWGYCHRKIGNSVLLMDRSVFIYKYTLVCVCKKKM